ncbi:ABC transporter ATP-binding protein [Xenorhabdus nematophila]|uniref:Transport protein (ABC superfamily, atp_bind) n=1 Tax=Xenorhabdus nematophila (strain ATCC 19061 / DSM 3370 / CCUG 14189 / LMG 1036 / NCIMB 9965 / AN6) TaxID=406817 RepID=D3V8Y8_XENNA|nr:ABC transporter ATP-binding protein [Xenorhabdus nematophila]CEE94084.1 putative transport protein (ABC superfamily, atp_bind) [Xenorhabdus nematophila str. Anatoliense]CEF30800.1 putative transport protein (ABC superfamily, atp_bind) [Xenorhabdus nematophila str. Websteri]AYA40849.1 ABC transporter ATP-binding protein [Xenorhabdus nematophila]KHD28605.1 ABC transporter ATP-binding protein [Xenorhabdus nematophila]MBA0019599.1 ABC transporter ATP-binding protein [Xenorhabdus nematophila]
MAPVNSIQPTSLISPVINMRQLTRIYQHGEKNPIPVLNGITAQIFTGQSCAIVGTSGSGKSTLLNILGLLDKPTSGKYFLCGVDMSTADNDLRARMRNKEIGFVFQSFHLLPGMTATENVALPLLYRGVSASQSHKIAREKLHWVGLSHRAEHYPADLSGGQRQRVALARALVGEPSLLLADEPTGNLDQQTAEEILLLLSSLHTENAMTLVVITHDAMVANHMQRELRMVDGQLHEFRGVAIHDR